MDLQAYIDKLREIDAPMQKVFYAYKKEILELLQQTFSNQQDPYQVKWVARRHYYPWPILDKTGNLKESFKVRIARDTFTISNEAINDRGIAYASYHQYGTKYLPVRKIIPQVDLPEHWLPRLEDYLSMTLQEYLE